MEDYHNDNIDLLNFINTMLYRCSHLYRKEMLSYNWQLNEDNTPFFIKYPYVWMFSGFDKSQREPLMKKTWDLVNHFYTYNMMLFFLS